MSRGRIAVAVDGSEASRGALDYALGLARTEGRPVAGVFVLDTGWADYIGNDWQSAAGARQGFLDYIRGQLEAQAELARAQFDEATIGYDKAEFRIIPGEPLETLCELIEHGDADLLVAGRDVFQVCGRPSVKRLSRDLPRRIQSVQII